jgi:hypothetical protein
MELLKLETNDVSASRMKQIWKYLLDEIEKDGKDFIDECGEGYLHWNLRYPCIVRALLDYGCDINLRTLEDGYTALMVAAKQGRLETVRILLERGVNVNLVSKHGMTALDCAITVEAGPITRLLLQHGGKRKKQSRSYHHPGREHLLCIPLENMLVLCTPRHKRESIRLPVDCLRLVRVFMLGY